MAVLDRTSTAGALPADRHWLNAERVCVYSWMVVVIFGLGAAMWTAMSLPDLVDPNGKPVGYDSIEFWSAARLALEGRPEAAYDWAAIGAMHRLAVPAMKALVFAWHYPPTFMLAVLPLGLLPYPAALAAFTAAGVALWAWLARRVVADRRAWIVAAAAPAGLLNLLYGQNGLLTASLAGFALLLLARRPVAAGVLIGLLAIKPHLAVLFPLALLAERQWRAIAAAAATTLLFTAAGVAAFGWDTLLAFLHDLPAARLPIDAGAVPWGSMPTPYVFALSLGASPAGAMVSQVLAALFGAVCVYRAWRNKSAPFEAKAAALLAGSLLVSPSLFTYDLTWAALAAGWLALLALRTGFLRGEREILLFAWLAPIAIAPVHALTSVQLGFPALVLLLLAALRRAAPLREPERRWLRHAVDACRAAGWVTRRRVVVWGFGLAAASMVIIARAVVFHTANGLTAADGAQLGGDFINYYAGAKAAASGQAALVYDHAWFHAFERAVTGPAIQRMYAYPPVTMLLSLPLCWLPFVPALVLWVLLGIGGCVAVLRRLVGWRMAAVAAIGAPAAFLNLYYGQNGYFTAALLGGGLMILERRPVVAGICFGCLAYKPHLALLVPFGLAAAAHWRAFAAAAFTALVLLLASLAAFGTESWAAFLGHMAVERQIMESETGFFPFMPTVFAAARLAGVPLALTYALQLVSTGLALTVTVLAWRAPVPLGIKAAILVVATFLALPYAWDYDTIILVFAAAWLGREGMRSGFLPWERLTVVLLLIWPVVAIASAQLLGLPPAPLLLWAALVVLARRAFAGPPGIGQAAAARA